MKKIKFEAYIPSPHWKESYDFPERKEYLLFKERMELMKLHRVNTFKEVKI